MECVQLFINFSYKILKYLEYRDYSQAAKKLNTFDYSPFFATKLLKGPEENLIHKNNFQFAGKQNVFD